MHEKFSNADSPQQAVEGTERGPPNERRVIGVAEETLVAIEHHIVGGLDNLKDVYPLSPLQEGILFHYLASESGGTYVLSLLFELQSRDNQSVLVNAVQKVMDRHDVLRSAVLWEGLERPIQVVHRRVILPVEELDLERDSGVMVQVKERMRLRQQKMDLRTAPLVRLSMMKHPQSQLCYAILKVHHIFCDHQSLQTLLSEVQAFVDERHEELPTPIPFRDQVAETMENLRTDRSEKFFRAKLADVVEPTTPFGCINVRMDERKIEESRATLESGIATHLRAIAKRYGVTPARIFHAAWALVVARTSDRDDVIFGTVLLATRQKSARAKQMLGLSVNTLPLRLRIDRSTAPELLAQVDLELRQLTSHEATPLTLAQRCSGITGSTPLITSILNFRRAQAEMDVAEFSRGVRWLSRGEGWTNYPITVTIDDRGADFLVMAKVDENIGADRIIGILSHTLQSLLRALGKDSSAPALTLEILPEAERCRVIREFNATRMDYDCDSLLHKMFELQVERTPQATAVIHGRRLMTYAELNSRANQVARLLRSKGVGPDRLVALFVERGLEMLIGLLGIIKAGGAYVPLDPSNPRDRLEHILSDADPVVVLTQERLKDTLPKIMMEVIVIDAVSAILDRYKTENLDSEETLVLPTNLAYVIYTSGSTGKPKGVMIEHRNIVNYVAYAIDKFDVRGGSGSLVCSSISFDLVITSLYPSLLAGKAVRLCREQQGIPLLEEELLLAENLAPFKVTPSHLKLLEPAVLAGRISNRVRALVLGGEILRFESLAPWRTHAPGTRIFNHYGPTETTVGCVVMEVTEPGKGTVAIGRPIANTQIYILDRYGQAVPVGVVGEIHVGGAGVGRGYINKPEVTAQRFLRDPFTNERDARMYKTGDLGRWESSGTIEYLGRNDEQVKIRGYRIEPAEVQAQLLVHKRVQDAVVVLREDVPGERTLVAYVVMRGHDHLGESMFTHQLREHIASRVPEYMVPSAFVTIDRIPLTPNGKVDKRALPAPDLSAHVTRPYEEPRGEIEEILAGIWQQLLNVERVGRSDNFFELGGHSLMILQLIDRLHRAGLHIDVLQVFERPMLAELAEKLTYTSASRAHLVATGIPWACRKVLPEMLNLIELDEQQIECIARSVPGGEENIQDIYPLAPLQEGILFHHLLNDRGGDVYVVPTLLCIRSRDRLNQLIVAMQAVVNRHDVLRTAVLWEQLPKALQVVYRRAILPVSEVALDLTRDVGEQIKGWMKPEILRLNLRIAPIMSLKVAPGLRGEWFALLLVHHIVEDATSLDIIISEIVTHLEGGEQHPVASLPYRNHVGRVLAYSRTHDAEVYFRDKLGDISEPTAPFGLLDIRGDATRIVQSSQVLEPSLVRRTRAQVRRLGVSSATLFHAAAAVVIARTSGRDDVVFGSVLLGRLQAAAESRQTLGLFINTLPLRLQLDGLSAETLLEHTQRELIGLLKHEQASLAVAQRCSSIGGISPLFSALVNYRHTARIADAEWIKAEGIKLIERHGFTNYPITFSIDDVEGGFRLTVQADRRVNPSQLATYLNNSVRALVEALEQRSERPVLALPMMSLNEQQQVTNQFNTAQLDLGGRKLVHRVFEEQVRGTPQRKAVVHGTETESYARLNARANQLARYLRGKGVAPSCLVGICFDRGIEMLVALLATLKAGGAYVPLDPRYPLERLRHMIEDSAPSLVLTQRNLRAELPVTDLEVICIDELKGEVGRNSEDNLANDEPESSTVDLVYVVYTSGSTGRPKGVAMPHGAMINLLEWHRQKLELGEGERVLQFAALSFDVAFQEIFSTICAGGTLVLLDDWVRRDVGALVALLGELEINRLFIPPLMLQSIAEYAVATAIKLPHLKDVIAAGEQLRITVQASEFFNIHRTCRLHNHYGPSETHVVTALTLVGDAAQWPVLPSIGAPISGSRIYILDRRRLPVPLGVSGEIYIAGANVARGYLNRAEITAERFLPDQFGDDHKGRMYRTGDIGRCHDDGSVEYLGRNDDQVKIRGYRIELGEIEQMLAQQVAVRESVVIAREDTPGQRRLVAYIVLREPSNSGVEEIRSKLKSVLPDYMVPSAFVMLDRLPLTPSGKLNRLQLPPPDVGSYVNRQYDPPCGDVEEVIARIWRELLQLERIGRGDDFFDLGGHSLLAMQLMSRMNAALSVEMPMRSLFDHPTLTGMAEQVEINLRSALSDEVRAGGSDAENLLSKVDAMSQNEIEGLLRTAIENPE